MNGRGWIRSSLLLVMVLAAGVSLAKSESFKLRDGVLLAMAGSSTRTDETKYARRAI